MLLCSVRINQFFCGARNINSDFLWFYKMQREPYRIESDFELKTDTSRNDLYDRLIPLCGKEITMKQDNGEIIKLIVYNEDIIKSLLEYESFYVDKNDGTKWFTISAIYVGQGGWDTLLVNTHDVTSLRLENFGG